jgi:actin-like ATPase involved in cell morphogenesis
MAAKSKSKLEPEDIQMNSPIKKVSPGVGLDIGTMNIVAARQENGKGVTRLIRDAFLDLDMDAKRSLKLSNVDYIETDTHLVVVGNEALNMANLFKREARRPLSQGVISAGELDAQEILGILINRVVGDPQVEDEPVFYSVPAEPIDKPGQDIVYHTEIFRAILQEQGFVGHPTNEAMAIIYSQCAAENFSGLSVSYGAGMGNVALAYQATAGMEFAISRGGDWVDQHAANAVGKTASQMCSIKEQGVDLANPKGRDQQAIAMYIRNLVNYTLKNIAQEFKKVQNSINLPGAVPFIVSGGTTKAGGFMDIFTDELEKVRKKGFPIEISEVRHATDPLTAVAEGLLVLAMEEYEERQAG